MNKYIDKHFKISKQPIANENNIVKGEKYRFTLLNEKVIRMEYNSEGKFIDQATQTIWNRDFEDITFEVKDSDDVLEIITSIFHLTYDKNEEFSKTSLKIRNLTNNEYWFYDKNNIQGNNENLKGTNRTLDGVNGELELEDGLFSKKGYAIIDDSKTLIFNEDDWVEKRLTDGLDLYYFAYGKDYKDGLKIFSKISGKTPMIPRYVFGNWWSRYWAYSEEELKELIINFEKYQIPLSVCIIDMDWHLVNIDKKYGSGWTGYTWNRDLFPDPTRMIKFIKDKNLKTALNLHPADGVMGHEERYEDFAKFMGIDYKNEVPIEFDCADPKFMHGYFKYLHHPEEERGIDFWWMDWQQGTNSKVEGLDPLWMLNHLHYYDMARDGKRPFIFSRWSKLGSHRYPIGFSGDTVVTWDSLDFQPYFTANAANVGYGYWSHDIGGHFLGKQQKELYLRWIQFGVFSPVMRLHSSSSVFSKREPWKWDNQTIDIVRKYMQFRHELIPYIYSMSYRNYKESIPLITPLYYDYPNDENAYNEKDNQYLFGSELLVSSITKDNVKDLNVTSKYVYLPEGIWYNYFTGEKFEGNKKYLLTFTLDEYPVFAKAGAIIPKGINKGENTTDSPKEIIIDIFPGKDNSFELYEDDNDTQNYLNGECSITRFNLSHLQNNIKLNFEVLDNSTDFIPEGRSYQLRFRNINKDVSINSNVKYESTYNEELKSLIVTVNDINNANIELTHSNVQIDNKYDYKQVIFEILHKSTLIDEQKEIIWGLVNNTNEKDKLIIKLIEVSNNFDKGLIDLMIGIINN